jgi:hypothetical protein
VTKPFAVGLLCFCVTLAILTGQRLSDQAMAVIVGSVIGILSSVPMVALMLWMLIRRRDGAPNAATFSHRDYSSREEQPRMIIVQPQTYGVPVAHYPQVGGAAPLDTSGWRRTRPDRDFTLVGEEEFDNEDGNALV